MNQDTFFTLVVRIKGDCLQMVWPFHQINHKIDMTRLHWLHRCHRWFGHFPEATTIQKQTFSKIFCRTSSWIQSAVFTWNRTSAFVLTVDWDVITQDILNIHIHRRIIPCMTEHIQESRPCAQCQESYVVSAVDIIIYQGAIIFE